jgi:hypothetical protein
MIETILSALAVGTFWFWFTVVISSIIFIASIENDHYATPSILAIVLGALFWKTIIAIAIVIGIYALVGIVWSLFKWFRYVQKISTQFTERYGKTLTESQLRDLKNEVRVSQHKARLTGWIAWWPWSLTWGLTGDLFNSLYDFMVNIYQKIVDSALGKFTVVKDPESKSRY